MSATRLAPLLATLALVMAGLTGCGSEKTVSSIDITIKNGTVKPSGEELKVKQDKKITLHITADKPGELHVHSTPGQEIEYDAGTSDKTLTIDKPGVVDVESHTLDKLVVKLQVS